MLTPLLVTFTVILGLMVGYVLQKGRACTNSAFRNLLIFRNSELSMIIIVTVCIEMVGYYLLSVGLVPGFDFVSNPIAFSWLFIPLGGFIFGLGTVFAGGCAGGTCYRVGEGRLSSILALVGFVIGIAIVASSPLTPSINDKWSETTVLIYNSTPSLAQLLPRWVWTLLSLILLSLVMRGYLTKQGQNKLQMTHLLQGWSPIKTGVLLGVLGVYARVVSTYSGRPFGLSTTDGIAEIALAILAFRPVGWAGIFIATLIIGSFIASFIGGELVLNRPVPPEILRYLGGGILLGLGAMLGYGCNFGHIFGGIPELGISSLVSVIFMMVGNYSASYLYYLRWNRPLPQSSPISIQFGLLKDL